MFSAKVGMTTCASIRSNASPGERCQNKPTIGSEWCGKHKNTQIRFASENVEHVAPPSPPRRSDTTVFAAYIVILRSWRRWLARRSGPLLHFREESNNPFDFFSSDPVADIPTADFVSFVEEGKGYIMDIKSALSLIEHASKTGETPTNPFNRNPLSALFLLRVSRHSNRKSWTVLQPMSETQRLALATTDMFRLVEDLGYYTDPSWLLNLTRRQLQQVYIELADIWFHRATLSATDRKRIVPNISPFTVPVTTALIMQQKALRPLILATCNLLVSAAPARADRQLGVMYVLGAFSIISAGAGTAYPWLAEMFSPGVTRIVDSELVVLHPSVLSY